MIQLIDMKICNELTMVYIMIIFMFQIVQTIPTMSDDDRDLDMDSDDEGTGPGGMQDKRAHHNQLVRFCSLAEGCFKKYF